MRVYYDNVIASGLITGRLWPDAERAALAAIEAAHQDGRIKRVTSRESWREQERTTSMERRAQLHSARDLVSVVQADHLVLGFSKVEGPFGTFATIPIVTDIVDEAIFDGLKALGVGDTDARHFMYALANSCHRFVTLDSDFLDRKCELEEKWPVLRVVRPSELAEELRSHGAG